MKFAKKAEHGEKKMEDYLIANGYDLETLKDTLSGVNQLRSELEHQIRFSKQLEDTVMELQEKLRTETICENCERKKNEICFWNEMDARLDALRRDIQTDRQSEAGFFKRLFSSGA